MALRYIEKEYRRAGTAINIKFLERKLEIKDLTIVILANVIRFAV
jgi:hypothetical protein